MDRDEKDAMMVIARWFFYVLSLLLTGGAVLYACHFISKPAAVIDIATEPNKVLYDYHYFSNQWQTIQSLQRQVQLAKDALQDKLKTMPGDKDKWVYQDREEVSHLQANVTATKAALSDAVGEYNARSEQIDRTILKSGSLPDHIKLED